MVDSNSHPSAERILILDFGGQYTHLIARNVRELGVYCEVYDWDAAYQKIADFAAQGIILSGGPDSVGAHHSPQPAAEIYALDLPVLGICYGMQSMAAALGGAVETAAMREYGRAQVRTCARNHLLGGKKKFTAWMSHGDRVTALPAQFSALAESDNSPFAAIGDETRKFYGVQFHPEVTHTVGGRDILSRFVHDICGCGRQWTANNIITAAIDAVREKVGNDSVILGLSGGVDSSVCAALLQRAIGAQLTCIFVDTGLLRIGEGDWVMATFADALGVRVIRVDAEAEFFAALANITDPERKRKIIGGLFIDIFEREAAKIKNAKWLAQGTIHPDVIESGGGQNGGKGAARVIKSHHNVGGLPAKMSLNLLEPLRDLFKDEVRAIGLQLGLPPKLIARHPFPGPGLGVRILGEVTRPYAEMLRQADAIFLEELEKHDLYARASQAFAVFLPVKSVGVVGDNRAHEYVIALRAVNTIDFMTADWMRIPHDILATIAARIINEVRGVSRVVYDISAKPPATIEWE